jgi:hypothetical protein
MASRAVPLAVVKFWQALFKPTACGAAVAAPAVQHKSLACCVCGRLHQRMHACMHAMSIAAPGKPLVCVCCRAFLDLYLLCVLPQLVCKTKKALCRCFPPSGGSSPPPLAPPLDLSTVQGMSGRPCGAHIHQFNHSLLACILWPTCCAVASGLVTDWFGWTLMSCVEKHAPVDNGSAPSMPMPWSS